MRRRILVILVQRCLHFTGVWERESRRLWGREKREAVMVLHILIIRYLRQWLIKNTAALMHCVTLAEHFIRKVSYFSNIASNDIVVTRVTCQYWIQFFVSTLNFWWLQTFIQCRLISQTAQFCCLMVIGKLLIGLPHSDLPASDSAPHQCDSIHNLCRFATCTFALQATCLAWWIQQNANWGGSWSLLS